MENTNEYKYVQLDDSNINHLVYLYKKVFNQNYTLEEIKAKYLANYTGITAQGHFAFLNNKPVAFHGAIPVLMKYKNKVELAAQYGDAMTLPSHTKKGLFSTLGELTDQVLIKKEVKFVWGFPNQNSEYGYVNKLNWLGNSRMKYLIIDLKTIPKEALYRKTKILEKAFQRKTKQALDSIITTKENLASIDTNQFVSVNRSKDYYNYKSFTPNYMVELNSCKVWIKPLGGLLVGDLEVKNETQVLDTIERLKELAVQLGLKKVIIQASPESDIYKILQTQFSFSDSWLIGYKNFDSDFPLEKLQFTYGDLDTF